MNEIKADDELKQTIINITRANAVVPQTAARAFRIKVAMIAVSCLIIFLLAIGGQLALHKDHANPSTLFSGFVITAYAADGAPLAVKPDVEFPLGQYSMFMSSVPGFPVTIVSKNADKIEVRTSEGQIVFWNPTTDSKVNHQGKEATFKSGDTIYWSPMIEGDPSHATESILEITAYKDNAKLGSSTIEIKSEDHVMYKGRLTNE
jgi:hypothetical protein